VSMTWDEEGIDQEAAAQDHIETGGERMSIKQHKALVAAIPEDLKEGEALEVSDDGASWAQIKFVGYGYAGIMGPYSHQWRYARRPAPALPVEDRSGNDLGTAPARIDDHIKAVEQGIAMHREQRRAEDHFRDANGMEKKHDCEMVLMPGLQWHLYPYGKYLRQKWACYCRKTEWRDVPEVAE